MRTIKFRGKERRTGKWFYGNLYVKDTRGRTHICTPERGCFDIDPETVGQFIGLYDKDGKEIYEGDILLLGNSPSAVFEVKWNESIAAFCIRFNFENEIGSRPLGEWLAEKKNTAIIGNVFDNPELMKRNEESKDYKA